MRCGHAFTAFVASIAVGTTTVQADQTDSRLDVLFEALRYSDTIQSARTIEGQIWEIWAQTDDDDASQLYDRGTFAMANHDLQGAVETFSELIELDPEFAEAWNKRATVYYLQGRFDESVSDIQFTLALEPRHFGALSGLGLIMMRQDRHELAIKSFEKAIEIHPHLPAAKAHIELLETMLDGRPL